MSSLICHLHEKQGIPEAESFGGLVGNRILDSQHNTHTLPMTWVRVGITYHIICIPSLDAQQRLSTLPQLQNQRESFLFNLKTCFTT